MKIYKLLKEGAAEDVKKIMDNAKKMNETNTDFKKVIALIRIDIQEKNYRNAALDIGNVQMLFSRASAMYNKNYQKTYGLSNLTVLQQWARFFRTWLYSLTTFDTGDFDKIFDNVADISDGIKELVDGDEIPSDSTVRSMKSKLDTQLRMVPTKLYKMSRDIINREQKGE